MSTTKTTDIFAASPEGFRSMNVDRPAQQLVRELVQNALDEDQVTTLDVDVTYHGPRKGTTVKVTDDSPTGIRDAKLIFTLWLSDKEDSPQKRGRMGRGLKELISVSDECIVRSCAIDAIEFERKKGGEWSRKQSPRLGRPLKGTEVTAFVRGWGRKEAAAIVQFLHRVRAPSTVQMRVGFRDESCTDPALMDTGLQLVAPFTAQERYDMSLPTVIYEVDDGERKARDRYRACTVECFPPPPNEKAWVYEMGIPVEQCDSPVSIDVQQRVILRERRDTLTESYRRELFAKVLSARVHKLTDADLRENHALTAAAGYGLSSEAKQRIAMVWTEGRPFASSPEVRAMATGHHIEVVNLRSLPEAVRGIVREMGTDAKHVLDARKGEFCPELSFNELSIEEKRLVCFFEWVAKGINRACRVRVRAGNPGTRGDFDRINGVMSLYREVCGKGFFKEPSSPETLRLLIHELSHWQSPSDGHEHGVGFSMDNDFVGGQVAALLLNSAEQARLVLKGEPCLPPSTSPDSASESSS